MKKSNLLVSALLLTVGFASGALAVSTFSDVTGHWAEKNIMWASTEGLVMGDKGKTTFRPDAGVTRAELVTVIERYDVRMMKKMTEMEAKMMKKMDPNYFPVLKPDPTAEPVPGATTYYVCQSVTDGSRVYKDTFAYAPFTHYYDAEGKPMETAEVKDCQQTTMEFYNSKITK